MQGTRMTSSISFASRQRTPQIGAPFKWGLRPMFSKIGPIVRDGVEGRDVVFVHIPKTGGTSLRNMLQLAAPSSLFLTDYGDVPETSPELRELIYERQALKDFRSRFD